MKCEACQGRGYLLVGSTAAPHGLRIEKCDTCGRFKTDEAAVRHVYELGDVLDQVHQALTGLVQYNDLDPDLYEGDDDGVLGRLMNRAHRALEGHQRAMKKRRKTCKSMR